MPLLAALRGLAGLTLLLGAAIAAACPALANGGEGEIVDYAAAELAGKGPVQPDDVGDEQRFTVVQPSGAGASGFAVIGGVKPAGGGTTASISGSAGERRKPRRDARPERIILIEYGVPRVPGRQTASPVEAKAGGTGTAPAAPAEKAPAREVVRNN